MNVMSDQLRGQVTYAGWMELCAEMVHGSGCNSFDFPADGGMSMESFLQQCAAQNTETIYDAGGQVDYAAMCESYAQKDANFQIIYKAYQQDASFRNTQILDVSFDNGAITTCRTEGGNKNFYVSYCGTLGSHDEWNSNADTVLGESRPQRDAASYFDTVYIKYMADEENARITVDGHSNGGNKAAYTMQMSEYRTQIDQCVSFDGEGNSDKTWAEMQSHEDHQAQLDKTVLIRGENDPVSGFATDIPAENQYFIHGDYPILELDKTHGMRYLFNNCDGDFSTTLQVECEQGEFSEFVEYLYVKLKKSLPEEDFKRLVRTIMASMQGDGTVSSVEFLNVLTTCAEPVRQALYSPQGIALRRKLPQLITGQPMQDLNGRMNVFMNWFLNLLVTVDPVLVKGLWTITGVSTLLGIQYDNIKKLLWENFQYGDSPYGLIPGSEAGQYPEMHVDTDDLRLIAMELTKIANECKTAGNLVSNAIARAKEERAAREKKKLDSSPSQFRSDEKLREISFFGDPASIRNCTQTACDDLYTLKGALNAMADLLEQAEADARLNAR